MSQSFKTIYFPDHPAADSGGKNLKLAFGEKDSSLYISVGKLSSDDLRTLLGYQSFRSLNKAAVREDLPINTFCLRVLRKRIGAGVVEDGQLGFPGLFIDSRQATYSGGREEPLHLWYPYLEGYSPNFVGDVLKHFVPNAQRVFDPFGGAGTTPLTVAQRGLQALYCEVNPIMQFLTGMKARALSLRERERASLIQALEVLPETIAGRVRRSPPDVSLQVAYQTVFGGSRFFDNAVYQDILRTRTFIDGLAANDIALSEFVTVAALGSLLPASLLTRAGDVRFKTEKERETETADYFETLSRQLRQIATDLARVQPVKSEPLLISEDAKALGRLPKLGIDGVITSPPYLNGTNYFRNTKVELWFLRCLRRPTDLSNLRFKAVTAGINDVTVRKPLLDTSENLRKVIAELQTKAYDSRIPRMVGAYFFDLVQVFEGLSAHLLDGAKVAIDIGDSCYAGVRVPTDTILQEILESRGYKHQQEIVLRRRLSRNGERLHQSLLIFQFKGTGKPKTSSLPSAWRKEWNSFKRTLPHQRVPYSQRNWGHSLHSLCSYEGKMKPSLAHFLIKTFVPAQGRILDPFAGVGTIPFEAALAGKKAFGFEISSSAAAIAWPKFVRPNAEDCFAVLAELERLLEDGEPAGSELESASAIRFNKSIPEYFHRNTLREVLLARRFFSNKPPKTSSESLVLASILHILHGNRPYALSRWSHNTTPFAPRGNFEYRPLIPRLRDKLERSLVVEYPLEWQNGELFVQDATSWWPAEVSDLDAVVTSPPFFDSTRFYLGNWMRLWFSGWERADFDAKPRLFIDERQKKDFSVYQPILRQAHERLKAGGVVVFHLGKSPKCDMAEALSREARRWFRTADIFSEDVGHCERHGVRDKGTVSAHQFLILQ